MGAHADTSTLEYGEFRRACGFCSLRELCWPMGLQSAELARLQSMVSRAGPLAAGNYLFRTGDRFTAVYAVHTGCIKSFSIDAAGHETAHGFHLRGELLGFDAVYPDRHRCNALVIDRSSLCVIPYQEIVRLSAEFHSLHTQVLRLMSRAFSRQAVFSESSSAIQRIATFLLDIHSRLRQPGMPENEINLPMSREDISNYLGIAPETLSRLTARLHKKGLIDVDRRHFRIVDPIRLDLIAKGIHQEQKTAFT